VNKKLQKKLLNPKLFISFYFVKLVTGIEAFQWIFDRDRGIPMDI
jgi:hypothetical protein